MQTRTRHERHGTLDLYIDEDEYGAVSVTVSEDLDPYIERAAIWRAVWDHNPHLRHLVPKFIMPESMRVMALHEGWDQAKRRAVMDDPEYRKLRIH